jgi:hypothetical protein
LRTGNWGQHFDLRGMKRQEAGENYIIRSFIICLVFEHLGYVLHIATRTIQIRFKFGDISGSHGGENEDDCLQGYCAE